MIRRALVPVASAAMFLTTALPALAQTGPTPPGVTPAWRIVMYVLLAIAVLALLAFAFAALNRRRRPGETGVEGPPSTDEDATPGPAPSDGRYGTQR